MTLVDVAGTDTELPELPELQSFARPRLRTDVPVLWRTTSSVQLGDEVVIDRVTRAHVAWLASLDGLRSPAQIAEDLPLPAAEARRLVRRALDAAALDDAARIPEAVRWAPASERDSVAARFGATLRTCRDLETAFLVTDRREGCRVQVVGDGPVGQAVTTAVQQSGLSLVDDHATVLVLADAPHPDVAAYAEHLSLDRPHLHVGVLGDRATIGPLVVPGASSCLRCAHLHRRDADPAWPLVAVQWGQAVHAMPCPPLDPVLLALAASHAALLLRAWAEEPTRREQWADLAIEVRLPDGVAVRSSRPAHPLCGCTWQNG